MNPIFFEGYFPSFPFCTYQMYMPCQYMTPTASIVPAPIQPANYPKIVNINIIYSGFNLPKTADGKPKFRMYNDHFCSQVARVDIANMTGNDLISSLGGGEGSSLQEVFEQGGGQWTLGYKEIKFDSGAAKKKMVEYGWARGGEENSRLSTIWVVFQNS